MGRRCSHGRQGLTGDGAAPREARSGAVSGARERARGRRPRPRYRRACSRSVRLSGDVGLRDAERERVGGCSVLVRNTRGHATPVVRDIAVHASPYYRAVPEPKLADHLRRYPLFSKLADAELMQLAERSRSRSYKRGEALFRKDDPGTHLYVVLDGAVKIALPG